MNLTDDKIMSISLHMSKKDAEIERLKREKEDLARIIRDVLMEDYGLNSLTNRSNLTFKIDSHEIIIPPIDVALNETQALKEATEVMLFYANEDNFKERRYPCFKCSDPFDLKPIDVIAEIDGKPAFELAQKWLEKWGRQ